VPEEPGLELFLKAHDMFSFKAEGIPGVIIVPNSYKPNVNIEPVPHDHGSQAKYFIDGLITPDGDALFLYTLDPNSHTSRHIHLDPLSEDNWRLHGKALLDGQIMKRYMHAPSGTNHQIKTENEKILFMALLRNAKSVPKDEWHTHIEEAA
jgi:hypothetical protein